jgi:hypothetical protein
MDSLTVFGAVAVTAMLVCYTLESRSSIFVLAFAGVALRRWWAYRQRRPT